VLEYYVVLRSVLRAHPHLRRCLKCCRHCGIFFLTHPCNAGRKDLRCPFGCRDAHRRRRAARRSTAYYRTKEGRYKKKIQNGKRRRQAADAQPRPAAGDNEYPDKMVGHVRMVTSLIEDRIVSRDEIVMMLRRGVRQHSLGRRLRIDYIVGYLNKASP